MPLRPSLCIGLSLWGVLGLTAGCAHTAKPSASSDVAWIDGAVVGTSSGSAAEAELAALAEGDPHARTVRLDRLLDLFDAARFSGDDDARETLWNALGGHATGVGIAATRDAQSMLLDEAMRLDEQRSTLAPDEREFVAAAIMLLTTDLQTPGSADDLVIQTLAFRTLATDGHPRIADNARWRLYDHARGTLAGATEAAPEDRRDVAVQALYVDRESVETWLSDTAPHARPAPPGVDELWAAVGTQTDALAADARWQPVVSARAPKDAQLRDTLAATLPATRGADWPLRQLPAGTGARESDAPIVQLQAATAIVDAGRPGARRVDVDADPDALADAMRSALARDGRGIALWVADPETASPRVAAVLRAARRAGASVVEIAAYEPRLAEGAPPVVVALPLRVVRETDTTPGARAAKAARIWVHLSGAGTQLAIDGRRLPEAEDGNRAEGQLDALVAAYPSQRVVGLTLAGDVQLRQIVDVLVALRTRGLTTVAWHVDAAPPTSEASAAFAKTLQRRAALGRTSWRAEVEPPFPLKREDADRLDAFADSLSPCLVELETEVPRDGVTLSLPFVDGALDTIVSPKPSHAFTKDARERLDECLATRSHGFRLLQHRDTMTVDVVLRP